MPIGDLRYHGIDDLLRWVDASGASGALEVGRGAGALKIYFDAGRLTFADRGAQPPTVREIEEAGIDQEAWNRALARPGARTSVSEALLAEGVARDAVERFALGRITRAVEGLRELWAGRFATTDATHPFGTAVGIDVSRLYRPPSVGDGTDRFEATLTLLTSDRFQITLSGQDWSAIASLTSPIRYTELVDRLGRDAADHLFATLTRAELADVTASSGFPARGDAAGDEIGHPDEDGDPTREPLEPHHAAAQPPLGDHLGSHAARSDDPDSDSPGAPREGSDPGTLGRVLSFSQRTTEAESATAMPSASDELHTEPHAAETETTDQAEEPNPEDQAAAVVAGRTGASSWSGRARGTGAYGTGAYGLVADLRKQMDVPEEARPSTLRRLITAITRL